MLVLHIVQDSFAAVSLFPHQHTELHEALECHSERIMERISELPVSRTTQKIQETFDEVMDIPSTHGGTDSRYARVACRER